MCSDPKLLKDTFQKPGAKKLNKTMIYSCFVTDE